jgi:hypothetical protein
MVDSDARAEPELHGLHGQRKRAGDHRLRRDDGRRHREQNQRVDRPRRCQQVERVLRGRRIFQQQRALSEVVEQQRRQHDGTPVDADRPRAEVPHVGVQRLAAGHDQEHRAEHEVAVPPGLGEELDGVERIDGGQHRRIARDLQRPEHRQDREPEQGDRPEHGTDTGRAEPLAGEQRDEDGDRDRHDVGLQHRRRHAQAFHRAKDRDGRRDDAVTVQERGAEHAEQDEQRSLGASRGRDRRGQRGQGEDAALAVVVGTQHEDEVLERDDDDQGPEDQREDAEHVGGRRRHGVRAVEAFANGVERAGADVAIHDTEGDQRQWRVVAPGTQRCWRRHSTGLEEGARRSAHGRPGLRFR